jgi:hypothetical protein
MRKHIDRAAILVAALLLAAPAAAQLWEPRNFILWQPGGENDASFGQAVATGDFDHDGYDDLAVGADGASENGTTAGRVDIYRGGPDGLSTTPWVTVPGEQGSRFGAALVAGDFDDDPRDELAVGAPEHDEPNGSGGFHQNAGRVWVFELVGENWALDGVFSQAGDGAGALEAGDKVGASLAVGDFDADGYFDLAAGAPGEMVGALAEAGAVNVFYGSSTGITLAGSQIWNYSDGIAGAAAAQDRLGNAVAAGDFDGDGVDDLAIGAFARTPNAGTDSGAVVVLYGVDETGLTGAGQLELDLTDLGLPDEGFAHFGWVLAAGDFNQSITCSFLFTCADDLAIGAAYQDVEYDGGTEEAAGYVHVVRGTDPGGLDPSLVTTLDETAVGGEPELGDHLGSALAAGAMDRLAGADLVVGIPADEGITGAVGFLSGAALDGDAVTQKLWASPTLESAPPGFDDGFGHSLAIGDFDGDGTGDLAIGLPGRDSPDAFDGGVVQILYGALFADGFERGNDGAWGP